MVKIIFSCGLIYEIPTKYWDVWEINNAGVDL